MFFFKIGFRRSLEVSNGLEGHWRSSGAGWKWVLEEWGLGGGLGIYSTYYYSTFDLVTAWTYRCYIDDRTQ